MHPRNLPVALFSVTCAALVGCTTVVDPAPDFEAARALVHEATGIDSAFDPEAVGLDAAEIERVLAGGLTLDEALALALVNNRRLHAGFLQLGVGRADLVQAGLLKNPSLSLAFLIPSGGGRTRIGADLVESVAELWQLERRKDVARLSQDQRILELSRFAGELIVGTRSAYFETVAAREARAVAEQDLALARSVLSGVQRQVAVGVATRTDESLAQAAVLDAELAFRLQAKNEAIGKQRLAGLLSLDLDMRGVVLTDELPGVGALDRMDETLVLRSRQLRLDIRSAALAAEAALAQVRLEQSRAIPAASVGLTAERPESGSSTNFLGGLSGSIELPLFDQNQAQVRRAEYRSAALKKELEALTVEVAGQVRAALDRAEAATAVLEFVARAVLPQAEMSAELARKGFDLGDTTVLTVLAAERRVLEARQAGLAARLEVARAQLDLERSVGAPLSVLRRPVHDQGAEPAPR